MLNRISSKNALYLSIFPPYFSILIFSITFQKFTRSDGKYLVEFSSTLHLNFDEILKRVQDDRFKMFCLSKNRKECSTESVRKMHFISSIFPPYFSILIFSIAFRKFTRSDGKCLVEFSSASHPNLMRSCTSTALCATNC